MRPDRASQAAMAATLVALLGLGAVASLLYLSTASRPGMDGKVENETGDRVEISQRGNRLTVTLTDGGWVSLGRLEVRRDNWTIAMCPDGNQSCSDDARIRVGETVVGPCQPTGPGVVRVWIGTNVVGKANVWCPS